MRFPWQKKDEPMNSEGILVPSEATPAELEEALQHGANLAGVGALFSVDVGGTIVPYGFPALIRCITLNSSVIAQLVSGGGLMIVDRRTSKRVKLTNSSTKASRAMELMVDSPDGRLPAYQWHESVASDLMTMSNYLVRGYRGGSKVERMVRQSMGDATTRLTMDNDWTYRSRAWGAKAGSLGEYSRQEAAHGFWGSLRFAGNSGLDSSDTNIFATPVLKLLRPAVQVGLDGEQYVKNFFKGNASQVPYVISFQRQVDAKFRKEVNFFLKKHKGRDPLVIGGNPTITSVQGTPQRRDTLDLRVHQIEEIGRVYGIPAPLLGVAVTSWGSGIGTLGKFAWRFGLKQHVDRYLSGFSTLLLDKNHSFRINPIELIRDDPAQMASYYIAALGGTGNHPPWMSIEEVRHDVGLPIDVMGELVQMRQPSTGGTEDEGNRSNQG